MRILVMIVSTGNDGMSRSAKSSGQCLMGMPSGPPQHLNHEGRFGRLLDRRLRVLRRPPSEMVRALVSAVASCVARGLSPERIDHQKAPNPARLAPARYN